MKKSVKQLSLLLSVSCLLGTAEAYAQSRPSLGRLNPHLPDIGRRLPQRPLPQKQQALKVSAEEVKAAETEYQKHLVLAVNYLKKNPKLIADVMNPQKFSKIASLIKEGKFDLLSRYDRPVVHYPDGAGEEKKIYLWAPLVTWPNLAQV